MKIEMLTTGPIESVLKDNNIPFRIMYGGEKYKIVELEKNDAKRVCNNEFDTENVWSMIANSSGGSMWDTVTINKEELIGSSGSNDSYDNLKDYCDDLGVDDNEDVCVLLTRLAKTNGLSLSRLFAICGW